MPKKISVPEFGTPEGGSKTYRRFKGLDYLGDETQIDDGRSPRAINIIADEGGFPERRVGWRTVHQFGVDEVISGVFPYEAKPEDAPDEGGTPEPAAADKPEGAEFLIHAGENLYRLRLDEESRVIEGTKETLLTGLSKGGRSQGFYMNGRLFIMTGAEYIVYDGKTAKHATDENAYVPLTSYQRKPTGGGETQDAVNMLCKYRKNRFVADGTTKVFQLDATDIETVYQPEASYFITGEKIAVSAFDAGKGTVTFSEPPKAPANAGTSNVEIKFAKATGDRKKILGCTVFAVFGLDGASNRVFVSGNKEHAATEWFSGLADPTYFPDINYSVVGSSDFPIMCYVKAQGELLVIKEDNRQEGTIWHHTGTLVNEVAAFPLKEGLPGYGAVSRYAAANLNDDPLYLSPRGVYAPTTTYFNNIQQKQLFCRSRRVNPKLCKETALADAVAAVWRGWYVLAVDGCAYVADGNQDKADQGYEWYYWTNIPAHVLRSHEQTLFFGTKDGRLCKFNDDMVSEENEILMRAYNDDGAPIHAEWCTKLDTMDTPMRLKTMPKRGSGVHLKAYTRSTVEVWIRTEQDHGKKVKTIYADRMNFADFAFSRVCFSTVVNNMIPFLQKKKKWKAIQVMLISDAVNEGFGVHSVVIRFMYGNYAKR